jgi:pectate lyase
MPAGRRYLAAVRTFADTVLEHGRDRYGGKQSPLFVDGLHVIKLEPALWLHRSERWVLSNLASQQALMRTLDGLTALTANDRYRQAAEAATRYAFDHLQTPSGLLNWGGHMAWDLLGEKPVSQYEGSHELKGQQPYFSLMWRVNPQATRKMLEAMWAGHILDWSRLDYNRHADGRKPVTTPWDADFKDNLEVPFPTKGNNLAFVNVMPSMVRSGIALATLGKHEPALMWTRRLVRRWQEARDPKTGLCGGQLSYREHDRAQDALRHVHPTINEAKVVASYHQTGRYHQLPMVQMQAGEILIAAGGNRADAGREFIRWASEDLKIYARHSYDPKAGHFVALMTDGTSIRWQESRTGYYNADSFAAQPPTGKLLWSYALAYRLTGDTDHWRMVRELARLLNLGDTGGPNGPRRLRLKTSHRDWASIYALIELHRATKSPAFMQLASRIGENLLETQTPTGLFPNPDREYARTGDELPLAVLHLAAALDGRQSELPAPALDGQFFHCIYDGPLEPHQQKRADKRTYDWLVFYGSR